jgi:outer membrane protein
MFMSRRVRPSFARIPTRAAFVFLLLHASGALAQSAPASPDRPWREPSEQNVERGAKHLRDARFNIDPKNYSLPELVDLAEEHNLETRVAWERARASAAAPGIAHSEVYPTLAAHRGVPDRSRGDKAFHSWELDWTTIGKTLN